MKRIFPLTFFAVIFISATHAQTPNWSDNVASIIYKNCSNCHHEGGIGPLPLMSYQDAVDNGTDMQTRVTEKTMPPWPPDPNYNHLKNERILSQSDIDAISQWVDAGYPTGNLANAPQPPVFYNGSELATIDQTIQIPTFTILSDVDEYRRFVIPSGALQNKYINKLEFLPGNGGVVHHILLYGDTTGAMAALDAADPLPGYEATGMIDITGAKLLGGWAPGSGVYELPSNMGVRVPPNTDFVVEVHYAPGSLGELDSSKINIVYTTSSSVREISVNPILYHYPPCLQEGTLWIPANQTQTYHENTFIIGDYSAINVFPHMHLIGRSFKIWIETAGGDSIPMISIPSWNFHWQGFYSFQKVMKIPSLCTVKGVATYDNTSNNPFNPNDPPQLVTLGEATTDEMMLGFFSYTNYEAGDENIVLDSSILSGTDPTVVRDLNFQVNPSLFHQGVFIQSDNWNNESFTLNIYDLLGREMIQPQNFSSSFEYVDLSALADGPYIVRITSAGRSSSFKVMKQD